MGLYSSKFKVFTLVTQSAYQLIHSLYFILKLFFKTFLKMWQHAATSPNYYKNIKQ